MMEKLRGMFAFALWDERKRVLLLGRDRLGQKPLVYVQDRDRIAFASELSALLEVPWVQRSVDLEALDLYLTFQYVPHPWTMLQGVKKLPPGHGGIWRDGHFETFQYWHLHPQSPLSRKEDALEQLVHLLQESVSMRLMSDVPLGAFLSGGLDSSIIVALMAREMSTPVKTFSIGFQESHFDERAYARAVAKHLGTEHEEFVVTPHCLDILPDLVNHYGEPFGDSSAIPTFYLSRMTARNVKVALSGDGGDELFHGYPRYQAVKLASMYDRMPTALKGCCRSAANLLPDIRHRWTRRGKRFLSHLESSPLQRYLEWIDIFSEVEKERVLSSEVLAARKTSPISFLVPYYERATSLDIVSKVAFMDLHTYLPCDILAKVDIASMAYSLECRSPFLDHKLVEWTVSLPASMKMRHLQTKRALRKAFGHLLPPCVLRRQKKGFGVPLAQWFRTDLREYVQDVLVHGICIQEGLLEKKGISNLVKEHSQGNRDHGYRLWSLLVLEEWISKVLRASHQHRLSR